MLNGDGHTLIKFDQPLYNWMNFNPLMPKLKPGSEEQSPYYLQRDLLGNRKDRDGYWDTAEAGE